MKKINLKMLLSGMLLFSLTLMTVAPSFAQTTVPQKKAKNNKAGLMTPAKSSVTNSTVKPVIVVNTASAQNGRVIIETRSEIIEDDSCEECAEITPVGGGSSSLYGLLAVGAIPLAYLLFGIHGGSTPNTPTTTITTGVVPPPAETGVVSPTQP